MPILLYGDPHRDFAPLLDAWREQRPDHVVILGDLELERPFRVEMAPLLAAGTGCWWILGNHDTDSAERYDRLVGDYPEGDLGGRVVTLACREGTLRVAGLGGVYKQRIWRPDQGEPRYRTRDAFLRQVAKGDRWRGGLPLKQRDTIFPEDHERLARLRADVLVSHEAPSALAHGFAAVDDLARALGVRLVAHGHHHTAYTGVTRDGIAVRGLDGRECALLSAAAPG